MPLVRREWVDQVLVLDGGSTDGTAEYAREQGYEVHVQRRKAFAKATGGAAADPRRHRHHLQP